MPQVALAFVGESIGSSIIGGTLGSIVGSAIGGGLGSELSGGNFWQGALSSGLSAGLGATGLGGSITKGLTGLGLSEGLATTATNALFGGAQTALGGGNFLEGAVAGAVMPSVISGAKNLASSWGAPSTPTTQGWGGGSFDTMSGQWGSDTTGALNDIYGKDAQGWGNFLSGQKPNTSGLNMDKLIPAALNSGVNLYMNKENQKLAKNMASQADPYSQFRSGDATSYNSLLNNPGDIFNDPMYQAMAKQGDEAIMRQAAAMGLTDSGQLTNRISENRMALANQFYNQRLAQFGQGGGVGQNPAAGPQIASNVLNNNYLYGALTSPLDLYGYNQGQTAAMY